MSARDTRGIEELGTRAIPTDELVKKGGDERNP